MNIEELQKSYKKEITTLTNFDLPVKEYLSSFEKYIEMMKKIETLFDNNDKMKNLRF